MRKTILCCEDNEILLDFLISHLTDAFPTYSLIECTNGLDAMVHLQTKNIDLIISDNDMQVDGGDGISLFLYTEKMNIDTPFIMYSASSPIAFSAINNDRFHCLIKAIDGYDTVASLAGECLSQI